VGAPTLRAVMRSGVLEGGYVGAPTIILPSHLRLGLPRGLLPTDLATKELYAPLLTPVRATCPPHIISLHLIFD